MEDNNHTDTKKRMSVAKSYREIQKKKKYPMGSEEFNQNSKWKI